MLDSDSENSSNSIAKSQQSKDDNDDDSKQEIESKSDSKKRTSGGNHNDSDIDINETNTDVDVDDDDNSNKDDEIQTKARNCKKSNKITTINSKKHQEIVAHENMPYAFMQWDEKELLEIDKKKHFNNARIDAYIENVHKFIKDNPSVPLNELEIE